MTPNSAEIAAELADARQTASRLDATICAAIADEATGYAVQQQLIGHFPGRLAGWKIGATSAAAQQMLVIDHPFYGPILEPWRWTSGTERKVESGLVGVEIEIAFLLRADLPARPEAYGEEEIAAAIASAHPAIELVGGRFALEGLAKAPVVIADFGGNAGFVHGPAITGWQDLDLASIEGRCLIDGEEQGRGTAGIVYGGPLRSLAWLADNGPGLRAGQWISTGTMTGLARLGGAGAIVGDLGPAGEVTLKLVD